MPALGYVFRMRKPALVLATLALLLLSGCQTDDPTVVPQPEPTTTPLFASDEEALAAAEEAYGAYQAVLDQITSDGGIESDRLLAVATQAVLDHEQKGFDETRSYGERTVGARKFDSMSVQSSDLLSEESTIVVYVCDDFSGLDLVDSTGVSVVAKERQTRYPLVVGFDATGPGSSLLVSSTDDWTGGNFCE